MSTRAPRQPVGHVRMTASQLTSARARGATLLREAETDEEMRRSRAPGVLRATRGALDHSRRPPRTILIEDYPRGANSGAADRQRFERHYALDSRASRPRRVPFGASLDSRATPAQGSPTKATVRPRSRLARFAVGPGWRSPPRCFDRRLRRHLGASRRVGQPSPDRIEPRASASSRRRPRQMPGTPAAAVAPRQCSRRAMSPRSPC